MMNLVNSVYRRFNATNNGFFVVLGHARTGTNLLCSLLNSHPDVTCAYEVLHPDDAGLRQKFHQDMVEATEHWFKPGHGREQKDAIEYIQSRLLPRAGAGHPFGTKVLYWQVQKLGLFNYLARQNFGFLHMTRNPVEVHVSQLQAQQTGQWFLGRDEAQQQAAPAMEVSLSELTAFCRLYRKQLRRYDRIGPRRCGVDYEVLCKAPQRVMDRVFGFLGVQPVAVDSYSRKQQSWNIRDRIMNFDDLLKNAADDVRSHLEKIQNR
ncbi:MAG: sulfotransferase [Xanthomonadales bacterium]|nr:sulfotransferase [Xanthomonadales bacterium]